MHCRCRTPCRPATHGPRVPAPPADARGVPGAVRRGAGPSSSSARPRLPICGRADRRAAIAEVQPDARIIAILREPASFLRSLHLQLLQRSRRDRDRSAQGDRLEEAAQGRQHPAPLARPQALLYSEHVRYVEQLRRYHDVFAPEQVLVLIYDDFRADNEAHGAQGAALPRRGRPACRSSCRRQPHDRGALAALDELVHAVRSDAARSRAAVKATVKALTPRRAAARALRADPAPRRLRRAAAARRAPDGRAAPPLRAGGASR